MKHILLLFSIAIYSCSFSQSHYCATTENLKEQLQSNPRLKTHLEDIERQIQEKINEGSRASILTIPVVFHVLHNGDAYGTGENITDEQILSQLDALNRDFNNRNVDTNRIPAVFKPLLGNMQVEFCLARFDESGNVFSGIVRHNLGIAQWDRTMLETNGKPNTIWNPNQYYNIWTARFTGDLNGVLGYAQFPGMSPSTDGVVLRYDCVGTTGVINTGNEMGRVATHETGHWMGLYHIWGDDGGEPNECAGSDSVGDTPNQRIEYYGRPTHPQVSCSAQNLFMNYMDYVDDSAKVMFSQGQVDRARAALLSQRGQLLAASSVCNLNLDAAYEDMVSPSDTNCANNLLPVIRFKNNGSQNITYLEIIYNIDGGTNKSAKWYGNLAPRKIGSFTLPIENVATGAHTFSIFLFNANGGGDDDYALNDNATKNFYVTGTASIGQNTPISEGFESSILPTGWSVENPNGDRTWSINTSIGGYSTSGQSMSIDNFDNGSNPTNRKDNLLTASYNLKNTNFPYLNFDVAYANRTSTRNDTLTVFATLDCGHTWIQLWRKGGSTLATQSETNILFTPTSTQWKTEKIDLNPYINAENIQFKFENKSGWGNVLYLDNINIKTYGVGIDEEVILSNNIMVYPNPANDFVSIQSNDECIYPCKYILKNNLGQLVEIGFVENSQDKINIQSIQSGLYYLEIKTQHLHSITKKLFITK